MKWIAGIFVISLALLVYMATFQKPWTATPCKHPVLGDQICINDDNGQMRAVTDDPGMAQLLLSNRGFEASEVVEYLQKKEALEARKLKADMGK